MSVEMEDWKLVRDSVSLAQILTFVPKIEGTKIVSKALDGSVYIQTVGDGTKIATVTIFASRDEIPAVNSADAEGAAVVVYYRDTAYIGYMDELSDWSEKIAGEYYTNTFKLLIEEEVSV